MPCSSATPSDSSFVSHTWVVSPRILNEIRADIPPSGAKGLQGPPGLPEWPTSRRGEFPPERFTNYTQIYNFPSLSWGANNWSLNWTDRREYRDDFSITAGNHLWKFGGAYLSLTSPEEQPNNSGTWNFTSDQPFNPSDPAALNPALAEAKAAGIKTVAVDAYVTDPNTYNLYNNPFQLCAKNFVAR